MELFSKRYKSYSFRYRGLRMSRIEGEEEGKFLSDHLRTRLLHDLRYVVESDEYLESFLVVTNCKTDRRYLHGKSLQNLGNAEVGYDLTQVIDTNTLDRGPEYQDMHFFDLLELMIIFCRQEKRQELIRRWNEIFGEEEDRFQIYDSMIVTKNEAGLRSIVPLIHDRLLRKKLQEYFNDARLSGNYETAARTSADILQFIFSSPKGKKGTKSYAEKLCRSVADKSTDAANAPALAAIFGELVQNAKSLNNQISNIRHTDRFTIPVDHPNFYKVIATQNIALAELTILSLPEQFMRRRSPEEMKDAYISKYKLEGHTGWIVKKPVPATAYESEIKPEDLPF